MSCFKCTVRKVSVKEHNFPKHEHIYCARRKSSFCFSPKENFSGNSTVVGLGLAGEVTKRTDSVRSDRVSPNAEDEAPKTPQLCSAHPTWGGAGPPHDGHPVGFCAKPEPRHPRPDESHKCHCPNGTPSSSHPDPGSMGMTTHRSKRRRRS